MGAALAHEFFSRMSRFSSSTLSCSSPTLACNAASRCSTCVSVAKKDATHRECWTKALLNAAHLYQKAGEFEHFGLKIKELGYDWPGVQKYKSDVVAKNSAGV